MPDKHFDATVRFRFKVTEDAGAEGVDAGDIKITVFKFYARCATELSADPVGGSIVADEFDLMDTETLDVVEVVPPAKE